MRVQLLSAVLAVGTLLLGCGGGANDGPQLAQVTGTVLYKDAPVSGAVVTFMVAKSPIATGTTDAEGKFTLTTGGRPGAPIGNAMVGIVKFSAAAQDMSKMTPADMANMAEKNKMAIAKPKAEIPVKYGNPETSTLVAIIVADASKNVFKYPLQD